MKKNILYSVLLLGSSILTYSQAPLPVVNAGELSVSPAGLLSVEGNFENTTLGDVTNDGTVIYYDDFANDGSYGISSNNKTSMTVFTIKGVASKAKQITGNQIASFYDVIFDSSVPVKAFDLKNNIDASGVVDFQNGIVVVDSSFNPVTEVSHGMFTFQKGALAQSMDDSSHIQGAVEKIGNESFVYPVGDREKYRYARISAPKKDKDVFMGEYIYGDAAFFASRPNKVGVIEMINDKEYWVIDRGNNQESDILLTLTWDELTTSAAVLSNPEEELHIVRWDGKQQLWVDEGGVVDMSTKEVTTIGTVKGYGIFTLGKVKKDWILDGDIVIYNLVTPDGDGKNDYFIIDNIKNYPNNKVEIFNRWGARVYETRGYDPLGDGSSNVFRGYSEGKVTVDKGSKLPSGTYYYVITYEYTDSHGSRMIKKAANLHLENN